MTNYQLGSKYPHERFVQAAIEAHFDKLGFVQEIHDYADYVGRHPVSGDLWVVEAKGKTASIGTDFDTGIGQLLRRMDAPKTRYGLAFPDVPQFRSRIQAFAPWVREALGLHWLPVSENGEVTVIPPSMLVD